MAMLYFILGMLAGGFIVFGISTLLLESEIAEKEDWKAKYKKLWTDYLDQGDRHWNQILKLQNQQLNKIYKKKDSA